MKPGPTALEVRILFIAGYFPSQVNHSSTVLRCIKCKWGMNILMLV